LHPGILTDAHDPVLVWMQHCNVVRCSSPNHLCTPAAIQLAFTHSLIDQTHVFPKSQVYIVLRSAVAMQSANSSSSVAWDHTGMRCCRLQTQSQHHATLLVANAKKDSQVICWERDDAWGRSHGWRMVLHEHDHWSHVERKYVTYNIQPIHIEQKARADSQQ